MAFEDFWFSEQATPTGASLRFSGNQWLNGSFPGATILDRQQFTQSAWVKLSSQVGGSSLYGAGAPSQGYYNYFNGDSYEIRQYNPFTVETDVITNAVYRDFNAWYHVCVITDTNQAVPSDRLKIYFNGVRVTSFSTAAWPSLGYTGYIWNTSGYASYIGRGDIGFPTYRLNGYLSDVICASSISLPPTTFGYFDTNGVWVPYPFDTAKANVIAAGGFGTCGFALRFESQYFNSATNVWSDQSGNGRNWTATWNCATGAGGGTTGTDIMFDGPTTNYAVINPLYPGASTSLGNLTTANATGKPSILPAFANSGTIPQIVGVNGAGVSWNGTEAGWTSTGNISFGQQSTFTGATGLAASKLTAAPVPAGTTGFQALLDTGANILTTAQTAVPSGLWWIKDTVNFNNFQFVDSVRGGNIAFYTPANAAPAAYTAPAGNSVAWCWSASTPFSNAAGSNGAAIASSGLTNQVTGFSIVSWIGDGTNGMVYHNLGRTPAMYFLRYANTSTNIIVFSNDSTFIQLTLNNDSAASAAGVPAPTSNLFSNAGSVALDVIAYVWAPVPGYSAFGTYTGNGSSDGPFVYCGFKPRFIMIKRTDFGPSNWFTFDAATNPYNPCYNYLNPSLINSLGSIPASYAVDFLSNGFKSRAAGSDQNGAGATYIYAAFAENPFGGSNVAPVTAR